MISQKSLAGSGPDAPEIHSSFEINGAPLIYNMAGAAISGLRAEPAAWLASETRLRVRIIVLDSVCGTTPQSPAVTAPLKGSYLKRKVRFGSP